MPDDIRMGIAATSASQSAGRLFFVFPYETGHHILCEQGKKGETVFMTRSDLLQDRVKAYRLRCAEAAYDAVLDQYLPGFVPTERMSDDKYLLDQKLHYHKLFSDSYVNYLAGESPDFAFPESFAAQGAKKEWEDLMADLQKVNAQPIPVYDAGNYSHLTESMDHGFQFRMQDKVSSQQVYFAATRGEVFSFTQDDIHHKLDAENTTAVDDTGRIKLSSGTFEGYFRSSDRDRERIYLSNMSPLMVNEFLKSSDELPLSVSECIRMHDILDEKLRGMSFGERLTLNDVYDAFCNTRHYAEGDTLPSFQDFSEYAGNNGPVDPKHGTFLDQVPLRSVLFWMHNQTPELTPYDMFGKDLYGVPNAYHSYINAYLNPDLEAQAKVQAQFIGSEDSPHAGYVRSKQAAVVRRSPDGSVRYENLNGEEIPAEEAYTSAKRIHPKYFPVSILAPNGTPTVGIPDLGSVAMADFANGKREYQSSEFSVPDSIGFSAFRPFLRKDVYDAFEEEAKKILKENLPNRLSRSTDPVEKKKLVQAVKNGVAVLEELDKRGLRYEIKPDMSEGQLSALVEDPMSMQFRVMDLKYPEYIGRAYYSFNNTTTRFSNDGPQTKGADGRWHSAPVEADEAMTRDLVAYALGEPVKVRSPKGGQVEIDGQAGQLVGSRGSLSYTSDSGMHLAGSAYLSDPAKAYHASYVKNNGKGFAALYSGNLRKVGRTGQMLVISPVRIANDRIGEAAKLETFRTSEEAEQYLTDAQTRAKAYLQQQVFAPLFDTKEQEDGSIAVSAKPEEELLSARLSDDDTIHALQQQYITYLTSEEAVLRDLASGTMGDTMEDIYTLEWMGLTSALGDKRSKEEQILDSMDHVCDTLIGGIREKEDGGHLLSFNFANVSKYGGIKYGDTIRALQAAAKDPSLPVEFVSEDEEMTMNRVKEQMVSFDPSTASDLKELAAQGGPDSFYRHLYHVVSDSLTGHGVEVSKLEIDDQGILHYQGRRQYGETVGSENAYEKKREGFEHVWDYRNVDGQLGQIFPPDHNGVVVTKFAHDDNYAMVPGYTATVHRGEGSVESRTVCHGYQQMLDAKIRAELHQSLCVGTEQDPLSATSINRLYRHLYDERYPADYESYFEQIGMDEEMMHNLIRTQQNLVRYDKRYIEESTLNARMDVMRDNIHNDSSYDGYNVTGRDLSVMGWSEPGYFDDSATQSSTGQGISRCLVSGAKVDDTGHIVKSEIPNDRAPILMGDYAKNIYHNPFDRRVMVYSNLMHAYGITGPEQTAHMTLDGWTMDDAFVVSKGFAERHMVPDENGVLRPMKRGDKICDFNGNKGVLSLVADPDMHSERISQRMQVDGKAEPKVLEDGSRRVFYNLDRTPYSVTIPAELPEGMTESRFAALDIQRQAGYRGCDPVLKVFMDNPNLSVVGSPFTAPSRMNGGTARDMMDGLVEEPLKLDDREVPGAMGQIRYIITDKTAEEKTHQYDEEDIKAGKGRSVSSQMLWSLQARNANALISEFFGDNVDNLKTVREKMVVLGYDLDEDYVIREGYTPHRMADGSPEERPIIDLPQVPDNFQEMTQSQVNAWKADAIRESFSNVSRNGGFLRIPYPLEMASGKQTEAAPDGNGYLLPLMPPRFRSEQVYDDNTSIFHDYTQAYGQIAEKAISWQAENARPVKDAATHAARLTAMVNGSQGAYNRVAEDIKANSFDNKWNDWKRRVMSHRMPQSFTAVGVPDPRLRLDEMAMSSKMAKGLGLKEGDDFLTWRDPLLRPEGICCMKVRIDDSLEGIAMNPVMDKRFDGDFDGDGWGGVKINTKEGIEEAIRLYSPVNSLIDLGPTPDDYTKDEITFALNMGLDIASAKGSHASDPKDLKVQDLLEQAKDKTADGWYQEAFDIMNDYVQARLAQAHGSTVIRYDGMDNHLASVAEMVNIGAKGKPKGLVEYTKWLGAEAEYSISEDGKKIQFAKGAKDLGCAGMVDPADDVRRQMLRNMDLQVGMATAIKSFGTGLAGAVSQRNVGLSRKDCPDSPCGDAYLRYALETTYGATQGILQAKHDAKEALQKYRILTDVLPALYAGRAIGPDENGNWGPKTSEDGRAVWNTKQDFIDQYEALCNSKTGLNFDLARDNIEKLADCLYDGNEDMYGRDRIRSAKDKGQAQIATIDHLAYAGGGFETFKECVGRPLFSTEMSRQFAPRDPMNPERFASLAASDRVFEAKDRSKPVKGLAGVAQIDRGRVNEYHVEKRAAVIAKDSKWQQAFRQFQSLSDEEDILEQSLGE